MLGSGKYHRKTPQFRKGLWSDRGGIAMEGVGLWASPSCPCVSKDSRIPCEGDAHYNMQL